MAAIEKFDNDAQIAYLKANPNYFAGKPVVDEIEWYTPKRTTISRYLGFMPPTEE